MDSTERGRTSDLISKIEEAEHHSQSITGRASQRQGEIGQGYGEEDKGKKEEGREQRREEESRRWRKGRSWIKQADMKIQIGIVVESRKGNLGSLGDRKSTRLNSSH